MSRLTLFLDWLDEAAGGLIRIAYLASVLVASGIYFGAGHLPLWIEDPLNGIMPWTLAFAIETHSYISARRVRAAWQENMALPKESRDWGSLKVNLAILCGLLAFSFWNQLNYLAETWAPPISPYLSLPTPVAYVVRAAIIPLAFVAAAFIAPMAPPVLQQIEQEGHRVLGDVLGIARKQRRKWLKKAMREDIDMTGALVELIPDEHARRVVSHAYKAIGVPMQERAGALPPAIAAPATVEPRNRVYAASYVAPEPQLQQHHAEVIANNQRHDYDIPADPWGIEDDDPGVTGVFSEDELAAEYTNPTTQPRKGTRSASNSAPTTTTKVKNKAISEGMVRSHKERKAEGRERRQRTIEADVYAVLDEWYAAGSAKGLTDGKLADKVFKLGHLTVRPSENNVSRYRSKWEIQRKREAFAAAAEPQPEMELEEALP